MTTLLHSGGYILSVIAKTIIYLTYTIHTDKVVYQSSMAVPICSSTDTTISAFKLLNALCTGCLENIQTLKNLLVDLFYSGMYVQSNLSYPDSCYPGTSLNQAADLPYFVLILQKLWAVQWVWPIIAYTFILHFEIRTNISYGHPLIPRHPDKRGLTVRGCLNTENIEEILCVDGYAFDTVLVVCVIICAGLPL